jgi:crossover junction endodeoxyribonuclease RuvC
MATTGFGVVESDGCRSLLIDYGCIRTSAEDSTQSRLNCIYRELRSVLKLTGGEVLVVEKLFFNKNSSSAMQVGEARGVVILAGHHASLPVFEYTPLQVKQAVTGYGRAEKRQIQQMVACLLALKELPRPDDAADALALALCHAFMGQSRAATVRRGEYV